MTFLYSDDPYLTDDAREISLLRSLYKSCILEDSNMTKEILFELSDFYERKDRTL